MCRIRYNNNLALNFKALISTNYTKKKKKFILTSKKNTEKNDPFNFLKLILYK